MRRSIAVVFDKGASPREIHRGLRPLADVVYLLADSPEARMARPVIESLGSAAAVGAVADAEAVQRERPLHGVVTFSERQVETTARIATVLGLRSHSPATGRLLTDKPAQRRRLAGAGVDAVRFFEVEHPGQWTEALSVVGLPAVLKPATGEGSRNAFLIEDEGEGERLVHLLLQEEERRLIVEEFLAGEDHHPYGDYVSVESAVADGVITHLMVSGKFPLTPPFREVGCFWPTHVTGPRRAAIEDLTTSALRALDVGTGILHTEISLTANGPRIIEINGRLGGYMNELGLRSGLGDLIGLAGRLALGEPIEVNPLAGGEVHFQYSTPAPATACRLIRINGADRVRKISGVQRYHTFAQPGDDLGQGVDWRPMDMVCGVARDHAGMLRIIRKIRSTLAFVVDVEGTEQTRSAAAMTHWYL